MKKVLLVAALAAAVALVSAGSASAARVKLSLIPLPKAALGSSAHGLALAHDSGVISNAAAARLRRNSWLSAPCCSSASTRSYCVGDVTTDTKA